jgi:hypothetical protein
MANYASRWRETNEGSDGLENILQRVTDASTAAAVSPRLAQLGTVQKNIWHYDNNIIVVGVPHAQRMHRSNAISILALCYIKHSVTILCGLL